MKNTMIVILMTALTSVASAKSNLKPKCEDIAVKAAEKANYKLFGAETGSCGSKLLHLGDTVETYLVCITDETDPSEWVVAVKRDVADKNGKVVKTCKVEYTGYAMDAATPNFDQE